MDKRNTIKERLPFIDEISLNRLSDQQLDFILHPLSEPCFLRACPGSGKTEVVAIKAAYEIASWQDPFSGMAILSFTKNSAKEISNRVAKYDGINAIKHPHFIGTIDSWLHSYILHPFGHILFNFLGRNGDKSYDLIDGGAKYDFLGSFQVKVGHDRTAIEVNKYYRNFNGKIEWQDSYFNLTNLSDSQFENLELAKDKFMKSGLATYQDAEYICYKILLENASILNLLSERFNTIFIDECQDLSQSQIRILHLLKEKGVKLFFIGDLNQAIYEFRKVDVNKFIGFVTHHQLIEKRLIENYRSNQQIVDVCQGLEEKIVDRNTIVSIVGKEPINRPDNVLLLEYNNIGDLPKFFIEKIKEHNLCIKKSAILGRNHSLLSLIRPSRNSKFKNIELLTNGLNCWKLNPRTGDDLQNSLQQVGKAICDLAYGGKGDSQNQYCPKGLNQIKWRAFLYNLLNDLSDRSNSFCFEEKKWKEWAIFLRNFMDEYWDKLPIDGKKWQDVKTKMRAPNGQGTKKISDTLLMKPDLSSDKIRITTIHSVKGETLDAVLLVSTETKRSKGGHFEHWISEKDKEKEYVRMAYVASSRPKHLLIWAIPKKKHNPKVQELIDLGFSITP
jgi:DNA helicase-2/ATP-dependent DNA helicase PcrA